MRDWFTLILHCCCLHFHPHCVQPCWSPKDRLHLTTCCAMFFVINLRENTNHAKNMRNAIQKCEKRTLFMWLLQFGTTWKNYTTRGGQNPHACKVKRMCSSVCTIPNKLVPASKFNKWTVLVELSPHFTHEILTMPKPIYALRWCMGSNRVTLFHITSSF